MWMTAVVQKYGIPIWGWNCSWDQSCSSYIWGAFIYMCYCCISLKSLCLHMSLKTGENQTVSHGQAKCIFAQQRSMWVWSLSHWPLPEWIFFRHWLYIYVCKWNVKMYDYLDTFLFISHHKDSAARSPWTSPSTSPQVETTRFSLK